jgi:aryl-alcohol dehydrogenase-like predicted oxidoreductase
VLIGASSKEQLLNSVGAIENLEFNNIELKAIEDVLE